MVIRTPLGSETASYAKCNNRPVFGQAMRGQTQDWDRRHPVGPALRRAATGYTTGGVRNICRCASGAGPTGCRRSNLSAPQRVGAPVGGWLLVWNDAEVQLLELPVV